MNRFCFDFVPSREKSFHGSSFHGSSLSEAVSSKAVLVLVIILVIIVAWIIVEHGPKIIDATCMHISNYITVSGGKPYYLECQDHHIVIDGFNILYYYHDFLGIKPSGDFLSSIDNMMAWLVPILKNNFAGRIMFVFKNREFTKFDWDTKERYRTLAGKYKVYIYLCEGLEYGHQDAKHSSLGRDDFYAAILTRQYKTRILSYDRYKDFDQFVHEVPNFRVYIINPDLEEPVRMTDINAFDYLREIQKPRTFRLEDLKFYQV